MVRLERFGGASGVIAVASLGAQFALVGTAAPDAAALLQHRLRWEWATMLRAIGALGIIWFTAGLATRLRGSGRHAGPPAMVVLGAGLLWGAVWLLGAVFNSAAVSLAATSGDLARLLATLGIQVGLVLTPALSIAFLIATGVAVLAAPSFPARYGYMTLSAGAFRLVLALVDWQGSADLAMRIMDLTLLWMAVTAGHLLGATRASTAAD